MMPFYERDGITLYVGDSLDVVPMLEPESISAVITDPPYGLTQANRSKPAPTNDSPYSRHRVGANGDVRPVGGFMGKEWDGTGIEKNPELWRIIRDAMKPGAHLAAFGGSRTYHRMGVAIEDAGLELRDTVLYWGYGSGFPKSHNINKALESKGLCCVCEGSAVQYNYDNVSHEGVPNLRADVAADDPIPSNTEHDMRAGMRGESRERVAHGATQPAPESADGELRDVRQADRVVAVADCARQESDVLQALQRDTAQPGVGETLSERQGQDATGQGAFRAGQSGVEGRRDDAPTEGQLPGAGVRAMPEGDRGDGTQGWVRDGAPARHGESGGLHVDTAGSGTPSRPRPAQQSTGESGTVAVEPDAQARGAWPDCKRCGLPVVPKGLGTALKPAYEPIIVSRKPISEKNVAANVLAHGTGALNIDASRIEGNGDHHRPYQPTNNERSVYGKQKGFQPSNASGRWPANVILDEDAAAALDEMSGTSKSTGGRTVKRSGGGNVGSGKASEKSWTNDDPGYGDTGGASRFFYVAKASRSERNAGLDGMPERESRRYGDRAQGALPKQTPQGAVKMQNVHPTVKPLALMRYLVTLIAPPGGIVLDPFAGSGTTLVACAQLGIRAIGVELSEEYAEIAARRIDAVFSADRQPKLPLEVFA